MPRLLRSFGLAAILVAVSASSAVASSTQEAIVQDDTMLLSNPAGTMMQFRSLGVDRVRVTVFWNKIAPRPYSRKRPRGFKASDPNAYPAANWAPYDQVVQAAQTQGIGVYFQLSGGAPLWATAPGAHDGATGNWKPSAAEFASFTRAVGARYSGSFVPGGAAGTLPRVRFWGIWNEPNYGIQLAPQSDSTDTIEIGAWLYRNLVDAAWTGLQNSGHGSDTILIGDVAPRGLDHPIGVLSGVKPLRFLRALYCVDRNYNQLRGNAAAVRGCPTNTRGSRGFRAAHPGLFNATAFADHPYEQGVAPNKPTSSDPRAFASDPDYADLPEVPRLERALDRLNRIYGSSTQFPIYNTEYSYWTRPPTPTGISTDLASVYINWAEYIHWQQPRIKSYMQYLLVDPPLGNFGGALELHNLHHKSLYNAFRLPIFLPVTNARRGRSLELWGCVRPAKYAPESQTVDIQFKPRSGGPFQTRRTVTLNPSRCYFDVHVAFPASGSVRLAWTYPSGPTVYSRLVSVTLR
jgi:hypothetical protein